MTTDDILEPCARRAASAPDRPDPATTVLDPRGGPMCVAIRMIIGSIARPYGMARSERAQDIVDSLPSEDA